ncbi:Phospholipase/carboxylesterase/thioesterase [Piptocephalis cylindrospora]|uniref:Acyl-protein thioesterase 1 n=1 Tax=Piptocephalis cylindrospora TaxID=1907219 RepID=A0A4P9XZM3_9FUNG|nr:Phospholipase/carboxylesterase/thioesterase [Piptocephalis cylindrospora]|eukprot:RKP11895.1 Phospholipase/carboxylesterase/thioesterase [Piptocephalis cylindrospora]
MASKALTSVVQAARGTHTATVIFLHGLGDSGEGWSDMTEQLGRQLPHVKFILPNAPKQKVTINMGMRMPSWYDIVALDQASPDDERGLLASSSQITEIVSKEVNGGIPASRILLGGFSQGCAVSLVAALTMEYGLAGICCLSGYLPLRAKIFSMTSDASKRTPIFWGHGDIDEVVRPEWGSLSVEALKSKGYSVDSRIYSGMPHGSCPQEMRDVLSFFQERLPNKAL